MVKSSKYHKFGIIFVVTTFMTRFSSGMVIPFLALYLMDKSIQSATMIGAILSFGFVGGIFSGFLGGFFSDKYGYKRVIISNLVLHFLGYLFCAIVNTPVTFAICNFLINFATNAVAPSMQGIVASLSSKEEVRHTFILNYTMINVAASIAPILGTVFMLTTSPNVAFGVAAFFALLLLITMIFIFYKNLWDVNSIHIKANSNSFKFKDSIRIIHKDKVFVVFCFLMLMVHLVYFQVFPMVSERMDLVFANDHRSFAIIETVMSFLHLNAVPNFGRLLYGFLLFENAVLVVTFQFFINRIKIPDMLSIFMGCFLIFLSYFVFAFSSNIAGMYVLSMFVLTVGEIFCIPKISIVTDTMVKEGKRGTYFGTTKSIGFLGLALGPMIGGYFYDIMGYRSTLIVLAFVFLIALIFSYSRITKLERTAL